MLKNSETASSTPSSDHNDNVPSLSNLPMETIWRIASFLDIRSLGLTSRVDHRLHAFLKEPLIQVKLLANVVIANPQRVEALLEMLHSDSKCIVLKRSRGPESVYRSWESISPLEYATWAGDTEMVRILLKAVPQSKKKEALKQLQDVKEKGIEKRVYLSPYVSLIEAYEKYITKFDNCNWTWEERNDYYLTKIKKQFKRLPVVGLVTLLTKPLHDRVFCIDYKITSPLKARQGGHYHLCSSSEAADEITSIRSFCQARTKELDDIIEQLQKPSVEMESHEDTDRDWNCVIS